MGFLFISRDFPTKERGPSRTFIVLKALRPKRRPEVGYVTLAALNGRAPSSMFVWRVLL